MVNPVSLIHSSSPLPESELGTPKVEGVSPLESSPPNVEKVEGRAPDSSAGEVDYVPLCS